ncbi:TPA: HAMP domain-containing protein [bacterium]|nr:HAMP domain-containing protein [bacterium]
MKLRTNIIIVYGTIFLFLMGSVIIAANFLIDDSFENIHQRDVENLRNIIDSSYKELGKRAKNEVTRITKSSSAEIVHALSMGDIRDIWRQIGSGTTLDILELGDSNGMIVSSAHDPARFGITDKESLRIAKRRTKEPILRIRSGNKLVIEYINPIPDKGEILAYVIGGYYLKEQLRPSVVGADFMLLMQGNVPSVIYDNGIHIDSVKDKLVKLSQPHEITEQIKENKDQTQTKLKVSKSIIRQIRKHKWFKPKEKQIDLPRIIIDKKEYTLGIIPLMSNNDRQLGAIIAAFSNKQSYGIQMTLIRSLIGVAISGIVAAYIASYFISKNVTKPIEKLVDGLEIISKGDLDHRIETNAQGEIKFLVDSINNMTASLKENRERALSAERIAVWQDVARIMAHEIKNPLWPIQSSIRSLKRAHQTNRETFDEIFDECTNTIIEEVDILRKIVDEFSQFARMPKPQLSETDLNEILKDTLNLYTNGHDNIEIKTNLSENIPRIMGDKEQLSRAFINIITNAVQAMPEGGRLTISTIIHNSDEKSNYIEVVFEDTGIGMSSEVQAKIFQPYFTTKEGGTGLGMAIVHRIITDHNGSIELESKENVGTKLTILLPTK